MKKLNVLVALLVVALMAAPALAGTVVLPGLVNTGGTGVVGTPDSAYDILDGAPGGVTEAYEVAKPGVWVAAPAGSNWIGPDLLMEDDNPATGPQGALDNDPVGDYTYTLTFDVAAAYVPYLQITGKWATDNGATMKLNGTTLEWATPYEGFRKLSAFTIASGFQNGENTLTFVVNNATGSGNPSGLLVCDLAAKVPEPASVAVWSVLCAIAGIAVWRRRK